MDPYEPYREDRADDFTPKCVMQGCDYLAADHVTGKCGYHHGRDLSFNRAERTPGKSDEERFARGERGRNGREYPRL